MQTSYYTNAPFAHHKQSLSSPFVAAGLLQGQPKVGRDTSSLHNYYILVDTTHPKRKTVREMYFGCVKIRFTRYLSFSNLISHGLHGRYGPVAQRFPECRNRAGMLAWT